MDAKQERWLEIEDEDDNMLVRLEWPRLEREFLDYLQTYTNEIERIVSKHLGLLQGQQCRLANRSEWQCGSFNICIPISITNWRAQRLMIRCPFPYRLKELCIDEKLRGEAATFV